MTAAPAWFHSALEVPFTTAYVDYDGTAIRTLRWGTPGAEPMLLVHGGLAHANWWQWLAPQWMAGRDIVALDLSGHGESGRRDSYKGETWVDEIAAVARHYFSDRKPLLVGHSLGGLLAAGAAAYHPDLWRAIVISDSPMPDDTRH